MNTTELVTMHEAAQRLGIARLTLRRRIAERRLPTFRSDLDKRVHLMRVADVQALATPIAAQPAQKGVAAR